MDLLNPAPTAPATDWKTRWFGTPGALRGWVVANLVANALLIVTGAVVRLTGSGLGCPTWPHCDPGSFVPQGEMGIHGVIEFGNRLLTFVLIAIALATAVTAVRAGASQRIRLISLIVLLGIPFQGVIGGITVLTRLNPYVVALHLLLSVALVALCTWLVQLTRGLEREPLPAGLRRLVNAVFWLLMIGLWLGTVVTGAGPHAGDHGAKRNGLDIETVAKAHAWTIWLVVAGTIALLVLLHRAGLARAARWALLLLAAELLQGAIGYAQYFSGLPIGLVICHMLGISLVTVAASWLYFGTRRGVAADWEN